ncbi:hypothetical protein L195_g034458, partial [Trifolium pratense]
AVADVRDVGNCHLMNTCNVPGCKQYCASLRGGSPNGGSCLPGSTVCCFLNSGYESGKCSVVAIVVIAVAATHNAVVVA